MLTISFLPLIISGADIKMVPLEPKRHVREDISTLTRSEVINNEEEHHVYKIPSIDTAESSSHYLTVPIQKKGELLFCLLQEQRSNL